MSRRERAAGAWISFNETVSALSIFPRRRDAGRAAATGRSGERKQPRRVSTSTGARHTVLRLMRMRLMALSICSPSERRPNSDFSVEDDVKIGSTMRVRHCCTIRATVGLGSWRTTAPSSARMTAKRTARHTDARDRSISATSKARCKQAMTRSTTAAPVALLRAGIAPARAVPAPVTTACRSLRDSRAF